MLRTAVFGAVMTACTFGFLATDVALAQADFPARPIKLIVPFTAGGGVDTVARILGEELKGILGQSLVIENMPGASGMRGAEAAVRSDPDGYTLLLSSAGEAAVNPHLFKNIKYDPARDLAPVSLVVKVPNVLVVNAASAIQSLDDLIAFAKKDGKASYSSSGVGNPQHLAGELLNKMASANLMHVPYRGAAQQVTDVLGNNVTATFASYLAVSSFVEAGQVKPVAVTSSERIPSLPSVPAMAEHPQLKGYDVTNWFGLFAPAKTPPAIIEKLNKAIAQALGNPAAARKLEALGSYPAPNTPQEFKSFVAAETVKFKTIIVSADIKAQ
jgi:tripartite-type tricarboxylate transporter receptor subunit TctC